MAGIGAVAVEEAGPAAMALRQCQHRRSFVVYLVGLAERTSCYVARDWEAQSVGSGPRLQTEVVYLAQMGVGVRSFGRWEERTENSHLTLRGPAAQSGTPAPVRVPRCVVVTSVQIPDQARSGIPTALSDLDMRLFPLRHEHPPQSQALAGLEPVLRGRWGPASEASPPASRPLVSD